FADEFLVGEGAVDLGGVEEGDAEVHGGADELDPLLFIDGRAVAEAQAHAAEAQGRHLQAALAECARLHWLSRLEVSQAALRMNAEIHRVQNPSHVLSGFRPRSGRSD